MDKKTTGKLGEKYAEKYIASIGYETIKTNFSSRFGEIDIIAFDYSTPKPELVFIEVKTRKTISFGVPEESITYAKKQKLIKTALYFMNESSEKLKFVWRIDVIGLQLYSDGRLKTIQHIKNILNE